MEEVIFLGFLALIWVVFATITDIKKREIPNWLNFSLIIFALSFRFFYSFFELNDFNFFFQGLIGVGMFFILGNLFYYLNMFAGGDYRLFVAFGAIIPLNLGFFDNLKLLFCFLFLFLVIGAFYGFLMTCYFAIQNFSKFKNQFFKEFKKSRKLIIFILIIAVFILTLSFYLKGFLGFAIFLFLIPYLYVFAKAVDDGVMVRKTKTSKLTEGDWLYKDIKLKNKIIKATWNGLSKEDIKLLKKKKKYVLMRVGLQFAPVFLISLILFFCFYFFVDFSFFSFF